MTGADLIAEFAGLTERCHARGRLPVQGVPDGFPACLARVERFCGNLFQPVETGGTVAVITPIWAIPPRKPAVTKDGIQVIPGDTGYPGAMLDLAAIDRRTERACLRLGSAIALGEHLLLASDPYDVNVVLSPTDWLAGGGKGVCPVDLPSFARWCLARPRLRLMTETVNDGSRLEALLLKHRTPLPQIFVQEPGRRAA
jgi:hypothetical protein